MIGVDMIGAIRRERRNDVTLIQTPVAVPG